MGDLLKDRVIIVTGAGRGIGRGLAVQAAAEGAKVVVNDLGGAVDGSGRDVSVASQVVQEIRDAGGQAVANTDSVSDHRAAENIVRAALDAYGRLDVLINVAGILRDRMVFNMTEEEWDAVVDVHMKGTFNTSRYASIWWRANRGSHYRLINFTSGSGLHGAPGQPNYAAAKYGIVGFTYSCANALQRYGVTANAIGPGAATRMTATVPTERGGGRVEGRTEMSPENVAPAVLYIASDRSDWLNGQVVSASGYQVGLYNTPAAVRQVFNDGPWDLDTAWSMMERSFKPYLEHTTIFQGQAPAQPAGQ